MLRSGSLGVQISVFYILEYRMARSAPFLKPQDLLVVLGIHALRAEVWTFASLAAALNDSPSQLHYAARRAATSSLLSEDLRKPRYGQLLRFLDGGVRFAFPAEPGPLARGIPTAASAQPLRKHLAVSPDGEFVWAHPEGPLMGQAIVPLYETVPAAALQRPELHELLGLVDALRLGAVRVHEFAMRELRTRLDATA